MTKNTIMRYLIFFILILLTANVLNAQKKMDYTTFDIWKSISEKKISSNGDWISYVIKPGKGDPNLSFYNTRDTKTYTFHRASDVKLDYNSNFAVFRIHPPLDSIENLKRKKTKNKDLPKDTLGIFNFKTRQLEKIADFKSFKMAEKFGGYIVVKMDEKKEKLPDSSSEKDTSSVTVKDSTEVKKRKENGSNGTTLRIINVVHNSSKEFNYIKEFHIAKKSPNILMRCSGTDTLEEDRIQFFDVSNEELTTISNIKGDYKNLVISDHGDQVSYMVNVDTTDLEIEPFDLYYWSKGSAVPKLVSKSHASFMESDWIISENGAARFSDDGSRMLFGIAPKPLIQDSTLLEDEIVNVEVWSYNDQVLYTQQEIRAEREKKRSYDCIYNTKTNKIIQIENLELPEVDFDRHLENKLSIGTNDRNYQLASNWEGHDYSDIYIVNLETGSSEKVLEKLNAFVNLSPYSNYGYWYSPPDSIWYSLNLKTKKIQQLTFADEIHCFDELNDRPMDARSYGIATWVAKDESLIIYDRFDLWQIDPEGSSNPIRLTHGREKSLTFRYVNLNRDLWTIPSDTTIMLHFHDHMDKSEGYAMLNLNSKEIKIIENGEFDYTSRPLKAKSSLDLIYTKQNFRIFPDLIHTQIDNFKNGLKITNANPQQKEYAWGNTSLMKWKSPTGEEISGMLVLPDNFDENKKYPLIVNFYERSSHGLHRHRAPYPHRSTINYSYYVNKGYVIFNPDIHYRIGEPGESCYDAVISGVNALLEKGFIDKDRMGVQGHSWGGYQIAHLLTRTNMFKCAESGAPVVNMISAYGGIRWGSGMSRMFQYEHTQSRLGANLWDNPDVYIANSPIFNIDKIETPTLILHNDKDGAVPWYQGIEFFMAMRRLNKKAWLLNYNDEPHWPLKRQNRIDFNRRMEQFFDHYLMNKPMPEWMEKGIPVLEKGINNGY